MDGFRTRGFAALCRRCGDESDPFVAWRRLPRDVRAAVVEAADRGQPHPYPAFRVIAFAWATAVCDVGFLSAWTRDVLTFVVFGEIGAIGGWFIVHAHLLAYALGVAIGGSVGGTVRLVVQRSRARRVLWANRNPSTTAAPDPRPAR